LPRAGIARVQARHDKEHRRGIIVVILQTTDLDDVMPIEPPEIPPSTPGTPTEPPPGIPPGNPQPEIAPPVREPGESPRPDELPGHVPEEIPSRGQNGPLTPNPATDASSLRDHM
jgi:hypothetical protein